MNKLIDAIASAVADGVTWPEALVFVFLIMAAFGYFGYGPFYTNGDFWRL